MGEEKILGAPAFSGVMGNLGFLELEPNEERREREGLREGKEKMWRRNGGDFVFFNFWKCGLGQSLLYF